MNLLSPLYRDTAIAVTLKHSNALAQQSGPSISIEVTRNFAGFTIGPTLAPPLSFASVDQQALLIYGSAAFTVKTIHQSSSQPGATNTITVAVQPSVPIFSGQGALAAITITGLVGSSTPDGQLRIFDTGSMFFSSVGSWHRQSGTIILRVTDGQSVPSSQTTSFKFDLTNPVYPQQSSDQILISASGKTLIYQSEMSGTIGNKLPLKVDALSFTKYDIGQSSAVPDALNTITVTFQWPVSVTLSETRSSKVTIAGIAGSNTVDTLALPITFISPSLSVSCASCSSSGVPNIFSPFDDVMVSLTDSCRWADNQVLIAGNFNGSDVSGTILAFTEGGCKGRWTKIVSFNMLSGCANLSVTKTSSDVLWDDVHSRCADLGKVDGFQVLNGGSGYRHGDGASNLAPFSVDSSVSTGQGLAGNCIVNYMGAVTKILVSQAGVQYSDSVNINCPSMCTSATCPATISGSGAILKAKMQINKASIVAGTWLQSSGSLILRVRDQLDSGTSFELSFQLKNPKYSQPSSPVNIMVGGALPIASTRMTNSNSALLPMQVGNPGISQSAVCASSNCVAGAACSCSGSFTNIPQGRKVYALRADVQCNGGGGSFNITSPQFSSAQLANTFFQQPLLTCKASCDIYATLLSRVDVSSQFFGQSTLNFSASVDKVGLDLCMAGIHLKVLFTLEYSSE